MHIQRLKDKLGNRSNASTEVEYDDAVAWPVGEPGRGIATIIEMVSATRLDCVLGSAAAMRQGCVTAAHYASHRLAFGARLIDHPAMTRRHRRPDARVGGRHRAGPAAGRGGRPGGARRRRRGRLPAAGPAGRQVLGLQADAR